jgi:hypothetical protein
MLAGTTEQAPAKAASPAVPAKAGKNGGKKGKGR